MNKNYFHLIKKLTFLLCLCLLHNCTLNQKPEFLRVENIKVVNTSAESITLKTLAFFNNPNDLGGTLRSDGIMVSINGNEVAQVSTEVFEVPAKKEFSIPLTVKVDTQKLLDNKEGGLLGGLINSFLSKELEVNYKGSIVYKALGLSYAYPIDETEIVKIKF